MRCCFGKRATGLPMPLSTVYRSAELHERPKNSISKSCFMARGILRKPQTHNNSASDLSGCNFAINISREYSSQVADNLFFCPSAKGLQAKTKAHIFHSPV